MRRLLVVSSLALVGLGAGCEAQRVDFAALGQLSGDEGLTYCCEEEGEFAVASLEITAEDPNFEYLDESVFGAPLGMAIALTIHDVSPADGVTFLVDNEPFDPANDAFEFPLAGDDPVPVTIEVHIDCDVEEVGFRVALTEFVLEEAAGGLAGFLPGAPPPPDERDGTVVRVTRTASRMVQMTRDCPEPEPPPAGDAQLTIDFPGAGTGHVVVAYGSVETVCNDSCVLDIPVGVEVQIRGFPAEPSAFGGWVDVPEAAGDAAAFTLSASRTIGVVFE